MTRAALGACLLVLAGCDDTEELGRLDTPIRARVEWHDATFLTVAGTAHIGFPNGFDDEQWVDLQVEGCAPLRLRDPFDEDSEVELAADPAGGRVAYRAVGQDWRVAYVRGDQLVVGRETFPDAPHVGWRVWETHPEGPDWSRVPTFRQARRGALEAKIPYVIGYLNYTPRVWESVWLVDGRAAYVEFLIEALDVPEDGLGAEWEMAVRNLLAEDHATVMAALATHLHDAGPAGVRARRLLAPSTRDDAPDGAGARRTAAVDVP